MSSQIPPLRTLALFCKVIDNYGDIGICWRFARQLQQEHGIAVTLWVDDLHSFQRICPVVKPASETQVIEQVTVRYWRDQTGTFDLSDIADIVIEFFACDIPPNYICAMAACNPRPVWFNLEGLSAEEWVEGCHTLPSPHPSLPLTKYFFFPGFNQKTGGLLFESNLEKERQQFLSNLLNKANFLAQFGVKAEQMESLKISLFCYPQAPVDEIFSVWSANDTPITCLVPEGVATAAVQTFLAQAAVSGATACQGALTLHVIPFVPQADYDKLLWSCDLNFVRGEDSFVRAQWAQKPFIWHIYPQDENLHHKKLNAFLTFYSAHINAHTSTTNSATSLQSLSLAWNAALSSVKTEAQIDGIDWQSIWSQFQTEIPAITHASLDWRHEIQKNGDFTSNLLRFARTVR